MVHRDKMTTTNAPAEVAKMMRSRFDSMLVKTTPMGVKTEKELCVIEAVVVNEKKIEEKRFRGDDNDIWLVCVRNVNQGADDWQLGRTTQRVCHLDLKSSVVTTSARPRKNKLEVFMADTDGADWAEALNEEDDYHYLERSRLAMENNFPMRWAASSAKGREVYCRLLSVLLNIKMTATMLKAKKLSDARALASRVFEDASPHDADAASSSVVGSTPAEVDQVLLPSVQVCRCHHNSRSVRVDR